MARGRGYHMPAANRGLPKIKTHSYSSVRDALPDFTQTEKSNTGVARVAGRMTAAYPKIAGWNGGPGGALTQPLVTHTGFKGYL